MADYTTAEQAAIDELALINGDRYDATTNPKGLAGIGYKANIPSIANDTALIAPAIKRMADVAETAANQALGVAVNAPTANSDSSIAIASSGTKTFHTTTDLQSASPFRPGMWVKAISTADADDWMWGYIPVGGLDYGADTMDIVVSKSNGSGTLASWYLIATGPEGASTGIASVVDDTSPQLGGDLDTNGSDINVGSGDGIVFDSGSDGIDLGGSHLKNAINDGGLDKTVSLGTVSNTVTIDPDADDANQFDMTLGGNITIALPTTLTTNTKRGFQLWIKQGAAGGYTVTWPSSVKGTLPTMSAGANLTDVYTLIAKKNGSTVVYLIAPFAQGVSGL
ncbi:MAG: hypothetical protein AB7F35_00540 [Acetobacteraceae bacterium]